MNEIPRRIDIGKCTPTENCIRLAMEMVESMGADVRLTDAINLLAGARESVADFVDGVQGPRRFLATRDEDQR